MADTGNTQWMSYDELASIRGITRDAAKRLSFRRKWGRTRGNDNTSRIAVPIAELKALTRHPGDDTVMTPAFTPVSSPLPADVALADALRSQVADLVMRLDRAERRLEDVEAAASAERSTAQTERMAAQAERDRLLTMLEAAQQREPTPLSQDHAAKVPVFPAELPHEPTKRVAPDAIPGPGLRRLLMRLLRQ